MYRYEKTLAEKMIEKQKAFDYCVYMMLTGFYRKTECMSPFLETKLFLYYRELNDNTAVSMEKNALRILEKEILSVIPTDVSQEDAEIHILPWSDKYGCHGMMVKTATTVVKFYIQRDGKNVSCTIQETEVSHREYDKFAKVA